MSDEEEGEAVDKKQIRKAIECLPLRPGVSIEVAVDLASAAVVMHKPHAIAMKEPTSKVTAERVEAFADAIKQLEAAAKNLGFVPRMSLRFIIEKKPEAESALRCLFKAVVDDQIGAEVAAAARQLRRDVRQERARPTDWNRTELAEDLADLYFALTHKTPGKSGSSGHFLRFVQDVFEVAGMNDGSGGYAKKAAKSWEAGEVSLIFERELSRQALLD